jgi:DNA-binding NtrC family response regulator
MTTSAAESDRILIVDDAIENLRFLTLVLERRGLEVVAAPSGEVALELLRELDVNLAIIDLLMPGMDGLTLCRELRRHKAPPPPVLFVSGRDEPNAVGNAFDAGAVDYITKPLHEREVVARVETHLNIARLQQELTRQNQRLESTNRSLQEQIARRQQAEDSLELADQHLSHITEAEAQRWGISGFVGQSSVAHAVAEEIRRLHDFDRTNVLITGESGSGKELIARAIHFGGPRREQPFFAVNCSAVPEELAESLFFGHTRGAFTGAQNERRGYFELAHRGTLFLDEVGDLPRPLQAKLLRALEDGSFIPIGSQTPKTVDVRVISATNADLVKDVRDGQFRQDLYFRLAQYAVRVPPLRERVQDIPLLAEYFLEHFATEMRRPAPKLTAAAIHRLEAYRFPGNIRELKNIVERSLILSSGKPVGVEHLRLDEGIAPPAPADELAPASSAGAAPTSSINVEAVKAQLVNVALSRAGGNVTAAARLLGVHRSWFYRRR